MNCDLHIHSIFSDGEFTPRELLNLCHEKNISVLAITDHNNLQGSKNIINQSTFNDITIIPGVEFFAKSPSNIQIHILGYNINLNDSNLNHICKLIMEDNVRRIKSLISQLKINYNITFKDCDIEEVLSSQGNIGRPDIAKLCLKYGYVDSIQNAFKYLLKPLEGKVVKKHIEVTEKDCIKYILEAGGIASLAHPVTLKKDIYQLKKYIEELANMGLEAVEVYHSNNPPSLTDELLKITEDLSLYQSIGSDYHGPIITPDIVLGTGKNNNLVNRHANIICKLLEGKHYDKDS